jgi:hypothetical protein
VNGTHQLAAYVDEIRVLGENMDAIKNIEAVLGYVHTERASLSV